MFPLASSSVLCSADPRGFPLCLRSNAANPSSPPPSLEREEPLVNQLKELSVDEEPPVRPILLQRSPTQRFREAMEDGHFEVISKKCEL